MVSGLLSAMFNAGYGTILTYDGVRDLAGTAEDAAEPSRQYQLADPDAADEARKAVESRFCDAVDTRSTGMFADSTRMIDLIQQLFTVMGYAMAAVAAALGGSWLMGQLLGLFGVSQFAIDANPLMVGGLTAGLALVFLVAAYASARKVRRVDVRELVAE